jgi:hypothetical protein
MGDLMRHQDIRQDFKNGPVGVELSELCDLRFLDRKVALAELLRDTKAGIVFNGHLAGWRDRLPVWPLRRMG